MGLIWHKLNFFIKYSGSAATTQILIRVKEKLKSFNDKSETKVIHDSSIASRTSPLPSSPPAYDEIHPQPPHNPYYHHSSPNMSHNHSEYTSPNVSGLAQNSPVHLYPDLAGTGNRSFYDRRNSYHGCDDSPGYI